MENVVFVLDGRSLRLHSLPNSSVGPIAILRSKTGHRVDPRNYPPSIVVLIAEPPRGHQAICVFQHARPEEPITDDVVVVIVLVPLGHAVAARYRDHPPTDIVDVVRRLGLTSGAAPRNIPHPKISRIV